MKRDEMDTGNISDGYHTFNELYEHRHLLFLALCSQMPARVTWKRDPEMVGWAIVYLELPTGQISYHLPACPHLETFKENKSHKWDGHTSPDVIERLKNFFLLELNGGAKRKA